MADFHTSLALSSIQQKLDDMRDYQMLSLQLQVSTWWKTADEEERVHFRNYLQQYNMQHLFKLIPGESNGR